MAEQVFRVGSVELHVDESTFGSDGGPSVRVSVEADEVNG